MNLERHLLLRAIAEINGLRRSNEILGAKVEVMELFGMALRARSDGMNCASEDIVWRMQERVDEIAAAEGNSRETNEK
jgi:hypothetical protein